jgi:hypothetical protein
MYSKSFLANDAFVGYLGVMLADSVWRRDRSREPQLPGSHELLLGRIEILTGLTPELSTAFRESSPWRPDGTLCSPESASVEVLLYGGHRGIDPSLPLSEQVIADASRLACMRLVEAGLAAAFCFAERRDNGNSVVAQIFDGILQVLDLEGPCGPSVRSARRTWLASGYRDLATATVDGEYSDWLLRQDWGAAEQESLAGPAQSDVAPDGSSSLAPPGAPSSAPRVNAGIGPAPESDDGNDKNGQ